MRNLQQIQDLNEVLEESDEGVYVKADIRIQHRNGYPFFMSEGTKVTEEKMSLLERNLEKLYLKSN